MQTAILAVGDLFQSLGDAMLPFLDVGGATAPTTSLLCCLLLKAASNEKQFVVAEAQTTLRVCVLCGARVAQEGVLVLK